MKSFHARALIVTLTFFLSALPAMADQLSAHADLDGLQVVPPNATPAFGILDATLDDLTGAFAITTASYHDLLGGSLNAQLRTGALGANGAFILNLTLDAPGATTGTFSGGGVLTAGQMADMIAGNTYVRISSNVFPAGEIRGQITIVPEPASILLLAAGAIAVLGAARRQRRAR